MGNFRREVALWQLLFASVDGLTVRGILSRSLEK